MKVIDRLPHGFLRNSLVYLLLAAGSLVFMWPFIWMLMASFKTDREMFASDGGLFPKIPDPPAASPWLARPGEAAVRPLPAETREVVLGILRAQNWSWPATLQASEGEDLVLAQVWERLQPLLPADFDKLSASGREAALRQLVVPSMLARERAAVLRSLVIGPLILRSGDLREVIAIPVDKIAAAWSIATPDAGRFLDDAETERQGRILHYDFAGTDEIRLEARVDAGFPVADLQELRLFLRPDDSWHALRCRVTIGGRVYEALESPPLADVKWRTFTWKLLGAKPLPANQIRDWIGLVPSGGESVAADGADGLRIEISLVRQSRLQAFAKKAWLNYGLVLEQVPFLRYTATSLFLVIVQVVATMFSCSLVAYSFARLRWPGRFACFGIMLGTMMLPGQVTMIPYFLIMKQLGWYNTLLPLWVPSLFANAFFVFLLVQFMRGIPRDLEDAAAIDGCGVLRIYWHVMLPLVKPTLAAIAIFTFMGVWNDFMGPLVFLQDQRLYPLSLGLYALNVQSGGGMGMMMAGSFLMTVPVIVIFLFAQRYFLQGITLTGMK